MEGAAVSVDTNGVVQETDSKPSPERERVPGVAGLNDSVDFAGRRLHIQTERIMRPTPHIITQVFDAGRVLLSRTFELQPTNPLEGSSQLRELMQAQHARMIQDLSRKQESIKGLRPSAGVR